MRITLRDDEHFLLLVVGLQGPTLDGGTYLIPATPALTILNREETVLGEDRKESERTVMRLRLALAFALVLTDRGRPEIGFFAEILKIISTLASLINGLRVKMPKHNLRK